MTSPHIVCLGCCCSASFRLIANGLKQESNIVEWMMAVDFKDIIYLFSKIARDETVEIISENRRLFKYEHTDIKTRHYKRPDIIAENFHRRAQRIRTWIKNKEPILFIRHDGNIPTKTKELVEFDRILRDIDKDVQYEILLFTPPLLWESRKKFVHHKNCNNVPLPKRNDDNQYKDIVIERKKQLQITMIENGK